MTVIFSPILDKSARILPWNNFPAGSMLRGLHFLEVTWEEWRAASRLGRQMIGNGHTLPLSDLVIAAVALERDIAVYTTDPHFDLFPNLRRFAS
jgi:predicted nucleic acid-binding protein